MDVTQHSCGQNSIELRAEDSAHCIGLPSSPKPIGARAWNNSKANRDQGVGVPSEIANAYAEIPI